MDSIILHDDEWDATKTGLVLVFEREESAERYLEKVLALTRTSPKLAAKLLEESALRGLAELSASPGPEHETRTGRRKAGGGKLIKGS